MVRAYETLGRLLALCKRAMTQGLRQQFESLRQQIKAARAGQGVQKGLPPLSRIDLTPSAPEVADAAATAAEAAATAKATRAAAAEAAAKSTPANGPGNSNGVGSSAGGNQGYSYSQVGRARMSWLPSPRPCTRCHPSPLP